MVTGLAPQTPQTPSSTIAFLTAAAVTAVAGIAYWSSASNTTAFGTLVFEILHVLDTKEKKLNNGNVDVDKTNNNEKKKSNEENNHDSLEKAFVSWLDLEENELSRPGKNHVASEGESLTDSQWIRKIIEDALLLTSTSKTDLKDPNARSFVEEQLCTPSRTSFLHNRSLQKTKLSPKSQRRNSNQEINCEKSVCDIAFSRSFRALKKATKVMMDKEPAIREDFFNGVISDSENDQWEEETKYQRRRSLSLSSSSSSWSAISSSLGSYEMNEDDSLVEEEEEVEKLLNYLRFVGLAKEASLSSSPLSPSPSPPPSSSVFSDDNTRHSLKRREWLLAAVHDYELLRSATIESEDGTDTQRAKVSYTASLHRCRKELVIAVHYDGPSLSISTTDDRNQIETVLMSSLFLQQQVRSSVSKASSSNSFFLLDEIAKSLSEEILFHYLHTHNFGAKETASSFLSSGYSLILCGHSMGAALVCRLGDMLSNRNRDNISEAFEVRVHAFGPPPCLPSRQSFCPNGDNTMVEYPFITSIVNNHDCVPRWTESNLLGLRISLNSIMNRKKRHFQRYYNQCNRGFSSTNLTTASTTAAKRRSTTRVPPFSASSRDWRMFWKSDQEPNALSSEGVIGDVRPRYIVPGKVVSIWNHSQDPMIIGAKVHTGRKHRYPSMDDFNQFSRHQRTNRKSHDVLGRLWIDEGMFSDHTIEAYLSNLELLLGQVGNTI